MNPNGEYTISTDRDRLDLDWIHKVLSTESYWAEGRSMERVERSVANADCYGLFTAAGRQVGFARLTTDRVAIACLNDVYIDREFRGLGLGKLLVDRVMRDVEQMEVRRILLATADAQELYGRFGFTELRSGEYTWMQRLWPNLV